MPTARACPEGGALRRLLLGQLPEPQAGTLEEHLSQCPHCQALLPGLDATDPLVETLRGGEAVAAALPHGPVVEGVMLRLCELSAAAPDAGGKSGEQGATPAADGPEKWDFLRPPEGPDELGRLGPYRVVQVLGAGGMAVVFRAEDPHLRRWVALKVIRAPLTAGAAARERFLREARAAAAIEHDHIVPIYQVGEDRGVPFLAMQLLQGESLADRLQREGRLPAAEVVRIGREAAEGLAAAHARGLVHRDVKPSNIWLEGSRGRVKILDFGLARAAADGHTTDAGMIVGTPAYMAPEQARAGPVDHRSDLFSLGCVLYHMTTGEPPFRGGDALSTLTALAVDQPRPPRDVHPEVPAGLSDLVMRLLVRTPADRPASAAAVVQALEALARPQAEDAAPARPEKAGAGGRPLASRRRRVVAAAAVVALVGLAWAAYAFGPAVVRLIAGRGGVAGPTDGDAPPPVPTVGEACPADALRRDQIDPYELKIAGGGDPDKAPAELVAVLGDSRFVHGYMVGAIHFSPDGKSVASAERDFIKIWDAATGRLRCTIPVALRMRGGCNWLAFSADGRILATTELTGVAWWDADTGQKLRWLGGGHETSSVAFSPDGQTFAWASDEDKGCLRLWNLAADRELRAIPEQPLSTTCLSFSPDSRTLIAGEWNSHTLRRWETATGRLLGAVEVTTANAGGSWTLSRDGRTLTASNEPDGAVNLWDAATGKVSRALGRHEKGVCGVALSPDKRWLATGGDRGEVTLWDLDSGNERPFAQLLGAVNVLAFSPDGKTLAAGTTSGLITLLDVGTGKESLSVRGHRAMVYCVSVSPDGRTVASASRDHTVRLWDLATGKEEHVLRGHTGPVLGVAFSPDGNSVASAAWDGTVRLWESRTGKLRNTLRGHGPAPPGDARGWVYGVAWSPNGDRLASAGGDGTVRTWNPSTGDLLHTFSGHGTIAIHVAFSPDGRTLASADEHRTVILRDAETGEERYQLAGWDVAFRPGGGMVATREAGMVTLYDLATGKALQTCRAPAHDLSVAFSPDGGAVVAGSEDGTVYLWRVGEGSRPRQTFSLDGPVNHVVFTPEGRHLVTANQNGTVCVLRLAPSDAEGAGKASGP